MPLVFVAGPYRADSEWQVLLNIRKAEEFSLRLWNSGFAVLCPHKNTAFFGGAAADSVWLDGAQEMLRRCDAVFAVPAWAESEGARNEVALARSLKIPVFEDLPSIVEWASQVFVKDPSG